MVHMAITTLFYLATIDTHHYSPFAPCGVYNAVFQWSERCNRYLVSSRLRHFGHPLIAILGGVPRKVFEGSKLFKRSRFELYTIPWSYQRLYGVPTLSRCFISPEDYAHNILTRRFLAIGYYTLTKFKTFV